MQPQPPAIPSDRSNKLATGSFVCGLASLILLLLTGIPAIILGHKSLKAAKAEGRASPGLGLAGLILGYLSVLTSLIMIPLVAIGFGAGKLAISKAKQAQALKESYDLVMAIQAFYDDFSYLPEIKTVQLRTDRSGLMDVLIGLDTEQNPKGLQYFPNTARGLRVSPSGSGSTLHDPWGNPYYVLMDSDFDDEIKDPTTGRPLFGRLAIAWSAGKDGKFHPGSETHPDNRDNVYSWK